MPSVLCEQINFCDLRPIPDDAIPVSERELRLILSHLLGTEDLGDKLVVKSVEFRQSLTQMDVLSHFDSYSRSSWNGNTRKEDQKEGVLKALKCLCVDEYFKVQ